LDTLTLLAGQFRKLDLELNIYVTKMYGTINIKLKWPLKKQSEKIQLA
jgi:hypothetical protein